MKHLIVLLLLASCSICDCNKPKESKWKFPKDAKDHREYPYGN